MRNEIATPFGNGKKIFLGIVTAGALTAPILTGLIAGQSYAATPDAKTASATAVGKIALLNGNQVKLNFQHVEVRGLLKSMAEAAHVNILVSDKVSGTISLNLEAMKWDRALDIILAAKGLTRHEKDGIIFIDAPTEGSGA